MSSPEKERERLLRCEETRVKWYMEVAGQKIRQKRGKSERVVEKNKPPLL